MVSSMVMSFVTDAGGCTASALCSNSTCPVSVINMALFACTSPNCAAEADAETAAAHSTPHTAVRIRFLIRFLPRKKLVSTHCMRKPNRAYQDKDRPMSGRSLRFHVNG